MFVKVSVNPKMLIGYVSKICYLGRVTSPCLSIKIPETFLLVLVPVAHVSPHRFYCAFLPFLEEIV